MFLDKYPNISNFGYLHRDNLSKCLVVAVEELSKSKIPSLLVTLLYMLKYRCLLYSDVELTDYHNYTQLTAELDRLVREHPDLAKVYSLGQTVEGRELAVIQISRGVNQVQFANNCMSVMSVMLNPCHTQVKYCNFKQIDMF